MPGPDPSARLIHARLVPRRAGRAVLLDAVAGPDGACELFFTHDTPLDAIAPGPGIARLEARTVGAAPFVRVEPEDGADPVLPSTGWSFPSPRAAPRQRRSPGAMSRSRSGMAKAPRWCSTGSASTPGTSASTAR